MGTSLNSIMDVHPELNKAEPVEGPRPTFGDFVGALEKMGQRHGKMDKALVQTAHDALADLVNGIQCDMEDAAKAAAGDLTKANARHSKKDLEEIKKAHDVVKGLGAECPGRKETAKE